MKPKLALIGYGYMGKEVEKIAVSHGLIISDIFEIDKKMSVDKSYDFDVAIDFSLPEYVEENVNIVAELNKSIVIGTTGWYDKIDVIKSIVVNSGIACIYASNFSIGMQIYFRIIRGAAEMINNFHEYDIMLHEAHHKRKKDIPSGSAITIGNIILDNVESKSSIFAGNPDEVIKPEQLHISSTRGGEITGAHSVHIDSSADSLEITHRAKNRSGFAAGAVASAEWLYGKKGFYKFDDIFDHII